MTDHAITIGLIARNRAAAEAIAEALEHAAGQRVRASRAAAAELEADTSTPDKRTGAVRITKALATADALEVAARQVRAAIAGEPIPVEEPAPALADDDPPAGPAAPATGGPSPADAARARAALDAELEAMGGEDAVLDPADEDGADAEDTPADAAEVAEGEAAVDLSAAGDDEGDA